MDSLIGAVLDPEGTSPGTSVDYVNENTFEVYGNSDEIAIVRTDYTKDNFDNDETNGIDDAGEVFDMSSYAADPASVDIGINTDDPLWKTDLNPPSSSTIIAGLNGYYDDAFIKVEEQTSGNEHPSFGFYRDPDNQLATVDIPGDSSYWCVCVGWAYEFYFHKSKQCPSSCTDHQFYFGDDDPEDEGVPPHHLATVLGKAGDIPDERCMIYIENIRDRDVTNIAKKVSHEVGHCLNLRHSAYDPATGFEAVRDGIMGWQDVHDYIPCKKEWFDLVRAHTSPDRFSDYHIDKLRESATD